jgi:hypothetical protein
VTFGLQIEFSWHIPAFYQRLHHDGHDIDDNMMTITGAGLVFDAVVYVKNCAEEMHGDMDDVEHVPSTRAERAAGGFHNTLLHGLPVDESSSEEPTEAAPEVEMKGTAPESKGRWQQHYETGKSPLIQRLPLQHVLHAPLLTSPVS